MTTTADTAAVANVMRAITNRLGDGTHHLDPDDVAQIIAALDGATFPGGCPDCPAHTRLTLTAARQIVTHIAHADTCPATPEAQ